MRLAAPPTDRVERFRRDLAALRWDNAAPLALAVSGGPDSLALLLLAAAALPGRVTAATVDHLLRAESTFEALHVEDICDRLGVPHAILAVTVRDGPAGVQGEAREARYRALSGWAAGQGAGWLATGHHAGDQAETLLMRLQRGSGLAGLSGIRPVRAEGGTALIRPLLSWTKAELVHLVAQAGIESVDDPSNHDPRYDRTAARALLARNPQFEPLRLARSAAALREADEALHWVAEALVAERTSPHSEGGWRVDPSALPRELRRRLLRWAIDRVRRDAGLDPIAGLDVETLLTSLEQGGGGSLAGIVASGGGPGWHLRPEPPRRPVKAASRP
jgi:tRNA(Ile)-lysidine synthase